MNSKIQEKDPFGHRIKEYEASAEIYLDRSKYSIMRIDGHGFSKWTKGFEKPFDEFLANALAETSRALMDEFKSVCAYSQSDEITLIFAPDDNLIYSGRIQKLTSLAASFASMKFNELIRETLRQLYTEKEDLMCVMSASVELSKEYDKVKDKVSFLEAKIGRAFFDARVFQVPDKIEAFNSLLWRTRDCERNSKNVFAQCILPHKECQNKTSDELVDLCEDLGHFWRDIPDKYKYGILWKKETYLKQPEHPDLEPCFRTRFIQITKRLNYSDENVEMILCNKL